MIKKIGFIGQGWVGKNMADWFKQTGKYEIVRYGRELEFVGNKAKIKYCDVVFISVPTPTTPNGFNYDIIDETLELVGKGKITVIKSTILPGTTRKLQEKYPNLNIIFSPEFLTEKTAAYDVAHPFRNILGYTNDQAFKKCGALMSILPSAPYEKIVRAEEAEMIKYGGNNWFYFKVIYVNLLYDLCDKLGIDYEEVKDGMSADPRIGKTHLDPVHQGGRGAGGHCFPKDFEAIRLLYEKICGDDEGKDVLAAMVKKNLQLLKASGKSLNEIGDVYSIEDE
jgi:nucleotide sugar dehydrogenase